jgi:hypothetical protein
MKFLSAERARKKLKKDHDMDAKRYLISKIKKEITFGNDMLKLWNYYSANVMEKKAVAYIKTEGKVWLENLGYVVIDVSLSEDVDEFIIYWEERREKSWVQ